MQHVVYSSVICADHSPENVLHFKSKLEIERLLAASGLSYTIIRPAAFLDNFGDVSMHNPLTKGTVSMLWGGECTGKATLRVVVLSSNLP